MKILVLMPLDEKWVYMANGIYRNLPQEVKDITFAMPMFMQYCITTKAVPNWLYATFDALVAVRNAYNAAGEGDLIVIGNCDKKLEFDAIFNFQDLAIDLRYSDLLMEKTKDLVKDAEDLRSYVDNLYTADDSKMPLHNCLATANFLTAYLQTDPKLEEIKKEYQDKVDLEDVESSNQNNKA